MKKFIILFTILLSQTSFGEYRVFQYYVKPSHPFSMDTQSYLVTSTLDPTTYLSYHGGKESLKVDLLRSWTCKGFTGNRKEYCRPPLEVLEKGDNAE